MREAMQRLRTKKRSAPGTQCSLRQTRNRNEFCSTTLPLFEVFIRSKRGLDHKHVGSLHAEDHDQALEYARDCYTRRSEGVSIWVVKSAISWLPRKTTRRLP